MRLAFALLLGWAGLRAQPPLDPVACRNLPLTHKDEDERDRAGRTLYFQCSREIPRDPAVAAALLRNARMGSAVAGPTLLLGYIADPRAREELQRLRKSPRRVKLQPWSTPVSIGLPATIALSRIGDADAAKRLLALSQDQSLAVREFLLDVAGDVRDKDVRLLQAYLEDTREITSGVPSGATPRRRLCDAAIEALSGRLSVKLPFALTEGRRYSEEERGIAREAIRKAVP